MKHLIAIAAAIVATGLSVPATAGAQTAAYYSATAVTAPSVAKLITQTTVWNCGGGTCVAGKASVRDGILCQMVAQQVGQLSAFTVAGNAFDAAALAKCNAHAK